MSDTAKGKAANQALGAVYQRIVRAQSHLTSLKESLRREKQFHEHPVANCHAVQPVQHELGARTDQRPEGRAGGGVDLGDERAAVRAIGVAEGARPEPELPVLAA